MPTSSTSPPDPPVSSEPAVPRPGRGRLGAAEAAVVITAITAVTVLAVFQRPIPAVLTTVVAAVCLPLLRSHSGHSPGGALGRLARMLAWVSRLIDTGRDAR